MKIPGVVFIGETDITMQLVDRNNQPVIDLNKSAQEAQAYGWAVKQTPYWSREPGSRVVVKRRIIESSLKENLYLSGIRRLKVVLVPTLSSEEINQMRRQYTGNRLKNRWQAKAEKSEQALSPAQEALAYIKIVVEKNGIANPVELSRNLTAAELSQDPLPLLIVWGPPYENQQAQPDLFSPDQPEGRFLIEIKEFVDGLIDCGIKIRPIILYADKYGTEINALDADNMSLYGQRIRQACAGLADFVTWSQVIVQNQQRYDQLRIQVWQNRPLPNNTELKQARSISAKINPARTPEAIYETARQYLSERLIEGAILTEGFVIDGKLICNIIKLGSAISRSRNDDPYEPNLPRIYIRNMTRAPWNRKR